MNHLPSNTTRRHRGAGFWLLVTATVALGAALPFFQSVWSFERWIVIIATEIFLGCVLAWLVDPARFGGALRLGCLLVALAYAKHMLDELGGNRPAHEAVIGFVVLGLPALGYALFGGLAPARPEHRATASATPSPPTPASHADAAAELDSDEPAPV